MVKELIGKKIGMTQLFDEAGAVVPVTVLQVGPCTVIQVKSRQTDQSEAVQVGFDSAKPKNVRKPLTGHFARAGVAPKRVLRDVPLDGEQVPELGQEIGVGIFQDVPYVDVTGVSKGRGFAGVVRRHGFSGAPGSHGHVFGRHTGSIGTGMAAHVLKGWRMPGHMGADRATVRNLKVVKVDTDHDLLLVRGAVPGPKGGYVLVRKAVLAQARS